MSLIKGEIRCLDGWTEECLSSETSPVTGHIAWENTYMEELHRGSKRCHSIPRVKNHSTQILVAKWNRKRAGLQRRRVKSCHLVANTQHYTEVELWFPAVEISSIILDSCLHSSELAKPLTDIYILKRSIR